MSNVSRTGTLERQVNQVLRYYELVDAQDMAAIVDLFTADATYERPGYEPIVGHQELSRFYTEQRVIDEGEHTVQTVVAEGDCVAVSGRFHGTLRDGREVRIRFADFFVTTDDGRFARRDTFFFAPLV